MNHRNLMNHVLMFALIVSPLKSFAAPVSSDKLCSSESYVVGFFNGVWNTEAEAILATSTLERMIGSEIDGENVEYETFYNNTGSEVNASGFQDIAEVFIQRAEEIEPDFGEHFEVFWSAISGDADGFLAKALNVLTSDASTATSELVAGLLSDLYTEISTESAALLSNILSDPPTQQDYERHSTRIKTLALQGNRLLLVAHSQGNLFVNNAYQAALTVENFSSENIGVVHIAPASSVTNGPHILANIDAVINGLRAFGLSTIPEITVDLPISHLLEDPSGHMLVPTYLNTSLATYDQVENSVSSEIERLVQPIATAEIGSFTATLTWNGAGDVDLHTFEPAGSHVYYSDRTGVVGYLDVDNTSANGPEHYFASCDPNILENGTYQIGVNNYSRADGRTAVIQISTPYVADLATKSVTLSTAEGSSGNDNPAILIGVTVTRDIDGNVDISAN